MHNGFYMQKYKYNKKEWQKLSTTHLSKLDSLVSPISKHNYLVQLGVVSIPTCNKDMLITIKLCQGVLA